MQLMPQTAAYLGVVDPMDPIANVDGGTRYIRELLLRYHSDLIKALAAYNAGPESVERFNGVPPYPETIAYVTRVIRAFNNKTSAQSPRESRASSGVPGKGQQATKSTKVHAPSRTSTTDGAASSGAGD
jgi:Transglycosylase SLT domain